MTQRFNPLVQPVEKLKDIYKHKLKYEQDKAAILFMKTSIKVLRNKFYFSPDQIAAFQQEFEKEWKEHEKA